MENAAFLTESRALLSEGETAKAIRALLNGLEANPTGQSETVRALRLLESKVAAVRQQEIKGILSFAEAQREYSKNTDAVLSILADLEAGRTPVPEQAGRNRRRLWLAIGLGVLLLAGLFYFRHTKSLCPEFEKGKTLKVMLLPFQNVGEAKARPELLLQNRIRQISRDKVSLAVEILTSYDSERENPGNAEALRFCKTCNTDLVVWGQYSRDSDSTRLSIQYQFRDANWGGTTGVVGVKNITDLQSGSMVKSLDDAVFSLCGMMAVREQNLELAKRWFEKVKEKDATDSTMLEVIAQRAQQ